MIILMFNTILNNYIKIKVVLIVNYLRTNT